MTPSLTPVLVNIILTEFLKFLYNSYKKLNLTYPIPGFSIVFGGRGI